MQEQLISFDTAKLAKEKGFDYETQYNYFFDGTIGSEIRSRNWNVDTDKEGYISLKSAPTQSLLQKWLREKYNIHILIDFGDLSDKFYVEVFNMYSTSEKYSSDVIFETYEEALEKGLQEALKLIN